MVKKLSDVVNAPLADLMNLSFETGRFSSALKVSRVVPIQKKGYEKTMDNYCPILVLSAFLKVYERIFYVRVVD